MQIQVILGLIVIFLLFLYYQSNHHQLPQKREFHGNIEELTLQNQHYRKVLSTTSNLQLVLMSLLPGEEIGMETHPKTSQFIRVEKGSGHAIINNQKYRMADGDVVVIPPGAKHNLINSSQNQRLQLYSIYTPPEHQPGTIQLQKPQNHHYLIRENKD